MLKLATTDNHVKIDVSKRYTRIFSEKMILKAWKTIEIYGMLLLLCVLELDFVDLKEHKEMKV